MNYIGHNQWNGQNFPNFYNRVISKDWDKIILFCQNEWAWHQHDPEYFPMLLEYCKKINKKVHIITGSHEHLYPDVDSIIKDNTEVIWWDTYWLGKTYHALINTKQASSIDPSEIVDYKYHFISMNHRPHSHRQLLVDLLSKHNLIESNAVSMHNQDLNIYQWRYFNFRPLILESEFLTDKNQHRLPQQYYDSFAQLISEASGDTIMISEKTAIPLIVGKPFLIAGQRHFHRFLKQLGFHLYEEIFDYSFDDIVNQEERYECLLENFNKLQAIPIAQLHKIHKSIVHKIEFNKRKAREIIYDRSLYPKLAIEVIEYYEKTGIKIDDWLINNYENLESLRDYPF
jgi:hypothetical protein